MKVTYFFLAFTILALIIILFRSENKFQFLKAGILFIFQIFFSTINFLIFFVISYLLMQNKDHINLGNLFILLAIFVILSGILLYLGMRITAKFFKLSTTVLTLIEYYIQWSLIYVTVYQAIFSNLKRISVVTRFIKVGNFLDPNLIIVAILPSFISAWIAIILYKKHTKAIQELKNQNWNFPILIFSLFVAFCNFLIMCYFVICAANKMTWTNFMHCPLLAISFFFISIINDSLTISFNFWIRYRHS